MIRLRYCVMIATVVNALGLYWFGTVLLRQPAPEDEATTRVRLVSLGPMVQEPVRRLAVPPAPAGVGRGTVGPVYRPGTFGEGGAAPWTNAGPVSERQAMAPGASTAAPGESGSPAPGASQRPLAGLGGSEDQPVPSPHEQADVESPLPPAPATAGAGMADQRPIGDLSPDPIKPSSVQAGQKGPGESAPGRGRPPSGDGSGPSAGPGPGGTATPDASPTLKPGSPTGTGGGGGASGAAGGAAGGGTQSATGQGGTGGGKGRGSASSGTGTGGGGGRGPAAGSPGGGAGSAPAPAAPKETDPVKISGPPPPRTREMERLEIHGAISVRVRIGPDGRVQEATVIKGSGYAQYDRTAASWVQSNWRFRPGTRGGTAVTKTIVVSVRY